MMASSHLAIGAAAWATLAPPVNMSTWCAGLGVCLAGSLLPDIDHPRSMLGSKLWFISGPICALFGHRSITHSLLAVMVAALLALVLTGQQGAIPALGFAFALGYASHVLADSFTQPGVPLLWPMKTRYCVPLMSFKTGDVLEMPITAMGVLWTAMEAWRILHPIN